MMLNDSWPQYAVTRVLICALQSLGPASLLYTAWNISRSWPAWPVNSMFQAWCALESVFLIFFLYFRVYLQRAATHPAPRSKDERKALFARVRAEVHDPDKFFSGWFRGAKIEDIGREDVKDFLDWAFWGQSRGPRQIAIMMVSKIRTGSALTFE